MTETRSRAVGRSIKNPCPSGVTSKEASFGPNSKSTSGVEIASLENEIVHLFRALEAIDRRDVRMVQGRENFCLKLEPSRPVVVSRKFLWKDLDRDISSQLRVLGAIDLTHPALSDRLDDFVVGEVRAGVERHQGENLAVGSGSYNRVGGLRTLSDSASLVSAPSPSCNCGPVP